MSKKVLRAIFDGDIITWEERSVCTPKIKLLVDKIENERNYFMGNMDAEQKERFDEYHCLLNEISYEQNKNSSYNNFMMRISVGIEIMEHKQGLLDE